ncbi:MAG: T9SS type A sorting domain-containing protein, partial [Bacteriovoracaceae bacterium]
GSLKDYYKEVSYNKLTITPAQTWSGTASKYTRGIINAYDTANGKKFIKWIMMPLSKRYYQDSIHLIPNGPRNQVIPVLQALRDSGQIQFDVDSYLGNGGKLLVVVAGGGHGGISDLPATPRDYEGLVFSVKEKNFRNYQNFSTLDGIWILAHEYGHTLGFDHFASSTYDPMNPTLTTLWGAHVYSPPHFNPLYKISRGWILPSDIVAIKKDSAFSLPPINSMPNVAAVTMYGDAGYDNYWNHSEYLLVEYRKREGFNRFSGGTGPTSFTGGALIWHISNYKPFVSTYEPNKTVSSAIGLKINNYTDFVRDLGKAEDFYYVGHDSIGLTTAPNSNSSFNLPTGIKLSGYIISNNQLNVSANYSLGAVPQWSQVIHKNITEVNSNLSGKVFFDFVGGPLGGHFQISNGTEVHVAPGISFYVERVTANAQTQNSIIFRGIGYGIYTEKWAGITLHQTDASGPSSIQKCLIKDAEKGITIRRSQYSTDTLANIEFQNVNTDFDLDNSENYIINKYPYMIGNSYDSIKVNGTWKLQSNQSISIPTGIKMVVNSGSIFQMSSGSNILAYGNLNAIGTSMNRIIFTPTSGSGPGAWGNIVFDGNGADLSKLEFCKFEGGGEVQCLNGADVFIDSSIFRRMNRAVYFNNSAPWILNNNVDSVTLSPVEGYSNFQSVSAYDNIVRRTQTSKNYNGLYFASTSGNIIRNKIDGFTRGMYFKSYSNPSFNKGDGSTPESNNRIINNTTGVYVRDESNPNLGDGDEVLGNNALYNNPDYNINAELGSYVLAENNFFGCGNYKIGYDQDSYVSAESMLSEDPFGEEQCQNSVVELPEAQFVTSIPSAYSLSVRNEYLLGLRLKKQKNILSSVDHFKSMYLSGKIPGAALSQLATLYSDSIDYGIFDFFESQRTGISKNQKQVLSTIAKLNNRRGELITSKALYDEIITRYPKSHEADDARYQKYYIALHQEKNKETASQLLRDLLDRYSAEETASAKYLYETAVFDIPESEKNQMSGKTIPIKKATSTESADMVLHFELSANYPNPFNPKTKIRYTIPEPGLVTLTVYDNLGRTIVTLVNEYALVGKYSVEFDAQKYASGMYFYKIINGNNVAIRKMLLIK